jgi:class 3 adenylate cyclase
MFRGTAAGKPIQQRAADVDEGAPQEQAVVGETPNLAARLQALAGPGAVVIAQTTHGLTGGLFEYEDLGAVEAKGFTARHCTRPS